MEGLTRKQQEVLGELEAQNKKLQEEETSLINEEDELHTKLRAAKKSNQEKKIKNRKLAQDIAQHEKRIETMEDNIDKIMDENLNTFDQYQEVVSSNNKNIDKMREDLGNVQKQHFEMEYINETIEQRIVQLKG